MLVRGHGILTGDEFSAGGTGPVCKNAKWMWMNKEKMCIKANYKCAFMILFRFYKMHIVHMRTQKCS